MDLAMRALGRRMMSASELREHLLKKEISSNEINGILAKMREYGYLNDETFAENFVRARISRGGRRKLTWELRRKGVDSVVIDAALDTIDPEAEIEAAAAYALRALRGGSDWNARNRAYGALQRRGYTGDVIRAAMTRALDEVKNVVDMPD